MTRKPDTPTHRGKALDLWVPPENAGNPYVCIATTFTFDAAFFETECLGRFLQMDTHPTEGDDIGYLIEREGRLHDALVTVLADRSQAGSKDSLRWDVLPISVKGGIQHAKLSLLAWQKHVRVVIGSGNLTEPGYRRNVEVFGTMDASDDLGGRVDEIRSCLDFLQELLDGAPGDPNAPGPMERARRALNEVRQKIAAWPQLRETRPLVVPVFGGAGKSILSQLTDLWPEPSPPSYAAVLSPFFDKTEPSATTEPSTTIQSLVDVLAKRGKRNLEFYVAAEESSAGEWTLAAPEKLKELIERSPNPEEGSPNRVNFSVYPVLPSQDEETRPLHAKAMILQGNQWVLHMLGSSNFTRAGLGLGPGNGNREANLVYRCRVDSPEHQHLYKVWPAARNKPIDPRGEKPLWKPAFDEGDGLAASSRLPDAFREALFHAGDEPRLEISLDDGLPAAWEIHCGQTPVLTPSQAVPGKNDVKWREPSAPCVLSVRWTDKQGGEQSAAWPVNVADPAKLPPPDRLRDLGLEELLLALASTRPAHIAIPELLRRRDRGGKSTDPQLDPHRRVDTQSFLLQRTRRVTRALLHLKERLERPASRIESLEYRMTGPLGVDTLASALEREASPPEAARFFLAELALTLADVDPKRIAEGGLSAPEARRRLRQSIDQIESHIGTLSGEAPIDQYVLAAFAKAKR